MPSMGLNPSTWRCRQRRPRCTNSSKKMLSQTLETILNYTKRLNPFKSLWRAQAAVACLWLKSTDKECLKAETRKAPLTCWWVTAATTTTRLPPNSKSTAIAKVAREPDQLARRKSQAKDKFLKPKSTRMTRFWKRCSTTIWMNSHLTTLWCSRDTDRLVELIASTTKNLRWHRIRHTGRNSNLVA